MVLLPRVNAQNTKRFTLAVLYMMNFFI